MLRVPIEREAAAMAGIKSRRRMVPFQTLHSDWFSLLREFERRARFPSASGEIRNVHRVAPRCYCMSGACPERRARMSRVHGGGVPMPPPRPRTVLTHTGDGPATTPSDPIG